MSDLFVKALEYYGEKEVKGIKSNNRLLTLIKQWASWVKDDSEIAWCSIFVNYIAKKLEYEYSNKLTARSWLNIGTPINLENAEIGDVVIFWRGSVTDWRGHVALYVRHDSNNVWVLGGNQNDQVNISAYSRERLLGVRRLNKQ